MAGDWIKMRTTLANDPAVISIACALDISEFEVVGMLHHLWSWADAQSRNGHAPGVTKKWIDRYTHRDNFADAMISVGWLAVDETGVYFPNFERHNGKPAKDRALAGERQRMKRQNVTQEVTETSRIERDKCVTREEKRREEIKANPIVPSAAFESFWSAYPKKTGKGAAEKAWSKANPDLITLDLITRSLESAKQSVEWKRDSGKFIPNPATWINQRRWEDEYTQDEQLPFADVIQAFNSATAGRLQPCTGLSSQREEAIRQMFDMSIDGKQLFRINGIPFFEAYFARCAADNWMAGANSTNTPVSIDYVMRDQIVHKVMGAWKGE